MSGFDAAELVGGCPPYPFWTELQADRARQQMREATEQDGDFQLTVRRRDGRFIDAAVSVTPVRGSDGELIAYVATYEDLSAARAQAQLERALRDVAAAAAANDPQAVFDQVAGRLAELVSAPSATIVRFEGDSGVIVGVHAHPSVPVPDELSLSERSASATVAATGRAAREAYANAQSEFACRARDAGLTDAVAVPVLVDSTLWGCLGVSGNQPGGLPDDTEQLLARFADLVSLALVNADAWGRLRREAATDGLTGLLNHRAFYERLEAERRRALRHERPLALAVFDLDGFKGLNDSRGHPAGDRALQTVAQAFTLQARAGDVVARLGGDEFAVIAPDTDAGAALALAERLRAGATDALTAAGLRLTLSCGVSDINAAQSVDDLVRLADGALYHAKYQGRNQAMRYAPDVVQELSYGQALSGSVLSAAEAMTRAVAANNGEAREHAEQVARVAQHVAARLGWDPQRLVRLREAALLHDVGKLAVPGVVLSKEGKFTPEEHEQVKSHAALGAQIAEGLLDDEQLRWMRSHHERLDGRGYPDGLAGRSIPDGARVLAVADAYDAITGNRTHRLPRGPVDAVAELRRCARSQFDPAAVDAIADWVAANGNMHPQ